MSRDADLAKTPLHDEHVALGGRMVPFAGYEMPVQYSGVKDEHQAVRQAAGVFDVSHMGEIELKGQGAGAVVDRVITNDAGKLVDGQALYTCACNERGTILDDLIVYRLAEDDWLVVCNAANRGKMVPHFRAVADATEDVAMHDASDETALVALQGPKAFDIAEKGVEGPDPKDLAGFHLTRTTLFGATGVVARTGYTGEDGFEMFCPAGDAPKLWRGLLEEGDKFGLKPAGLAARDTLRLEARLSLYGNDIDETTHPYEAGLGWTVKLDEGDFIGKAALERIKAEGWKRKLIGFEMKGRGIARHGYPLFDEEGHEEVGVCTSGSPSPTLGKNIGLGYLPRSMAKRGTRFSVDCRGRKVEAEVVKTPFYKRAS